MCGFQICCEKAPFAVAQVAVKGKKGAGAAAGPSLSPELLAGACETPADQLEAEVSP